MLTAEFIKAGKAVFTVSNNKGEHYTFKVVKPRVSRVKDSFFVEFRTGENYTYLGMIVGCGPLPRATTTRASKLNVNPTPFLVFNWCMHLIFNKKELPAGYKIQHEGKCGKCGRPLTNPQSIETGLGPVCSGKL